VDENDLPIILPEVDKYCRRKMVETPLPEQNGSIKTF